MCEFSDGHEVDGTGSVVSESSDRYEVDGSGSVLSELSIEINWTDMVPVALNLRFQQNTELLKIPASWYVTQ